MYAWDEAGKVGASETVTFTIAQPGPFPTTLVAVAVEVIVAVVSFGLFSYLLRHNRKSSAH